MILEINIFEGIEGAVTSTVVALAILLELEILLAKSFAIAVKL